MMTEIIFANDNSSKITKLRSEIVTKRNCGEIILETRKVILSNTFTSPEKLIKIVDLFVEQLGYSSLGADWKQINRQEAQNIISFVMKKDLAYSHILMTLQESEEISQKFFDFFPGNCSFLTNASFMNNYSGMTAWNSITDATFDTGIVIVSPNRIGILWAKDED